MLFLIRRGLAALVLTWLVVTFTFALLHAAPGDAADFLLPPDASSETAAQLRSELGLDRSVAVQYGRWMAGLLRGDLGESFSRHEPVTRVLAEALPVSAWLGAASLTLTFLVGIAVGAAQAMRQNRWADRVLTGITTTVYAAPSYWLALAVVAVFTYGASRYGLPSALRLPAFALRTPAGDATGAAALADLLRHSVLPVFVLSAIGAAGIARYARTALLDLQRSDWIRTARAKGVARRTVLWRHVLRNAMPPLVVLLMLSLPGLVAGSVFVESVFAWPGMGRTMLLAISSRDYPLVMAATMAYALLVILSNAASDVLLHWVDPRRRA